MGTDCNNFCTFFALYDTCRTLNGTTPKTEGVPKIDKLANIAETIRLSHNLQSNKIRTSSDVLKKDGGGEGSNGQPFSVVRLKRIARGLYKTSQTPRVPPLRRMRPAIWSLRKFLSTVAFEIGSSLASCRIEIRVLDFNLPRISSATPTLSSRLSSLSARLSSQPARLSSQLVSSVPQLVPLGARLGSLGS